MKTALRRGLAGAFAVTAAGGAAAVLTGLPFTPSADAAADPCAASEIAKTVGAVVMSTGTYLDAHPQTNQALTTITQQQAGPQSLAEVKSYFDANPAVAKDLQQIQYPLVNLGGRCKLPLSVPQLLGLVQAAQSQGGLPGSLPGAPSAAISGASAPSVSSPAAAVTPATGSIPGASATTSG
jgi:heme-binding protein